MQFISELIEAHIFRKSNNGMEFLLLKRAETVDYSGLWQMVTGKIRKDESAYKTALREIREETGLVPEKLWVAPNINSFYDQHRDAISSLPVFACRVAANSNVILSDEHCDYKWAKPETAKKLLAWPGQKRSVDILTEYFLEESSLLKFVEIML